MDSFLVRQYRVLFIIGIGTIAGLSFYVGILEGKQTKGDSVILSCSNQTLSQLTIPRTINTASADSINTGPNDSVASTPTPTTGAYAGSKNGTKYYTPGCTGLNRIKPENIIWFQTAEDATLQGYTPAKC